MIILRDIIRLVQSIPEMTNVEWKQYRESELPTSKEKVKRDDELEWQTNLILWTLIQIFEFRNAIQIFKNDRLDENIRLTADRDTLRTMR